jgi:hypothetical protein
MTARTNNPLRLISFRWVRDRLGKRVGDWSPLCTIGSRIGANVLGARDAGFLVVLVLAIGAGKPKRATIKRTCTTSGDILNMTDFQCGGSAWRLLY